VTATEEHATTPEVTRRFDAWLADLRRAATGVGFRTKIVGIILALTTLLGLVVTWQVRGAMTAVLETELDTRGLSVVSDLASRTTSPILLSDTLGVFELLDDTVRNHPDAVYAFVVDPEGSLLGHSFGNGEFPVRLLDIDSQRSPSGGRVVYDSDQGRIHDFRAPLLGGQVGSVRLGLSEDRLAGVVAGITAQMLVTTVFVGLAGVGAASLLTWLLTRPILALVDVTRDVGAGDLSARATAHADDEIGALSAAFNAMVDDLDANQRTIAENEAARSRLLEQLIDAQEDERKRIARELHDTVGQALTSMMVGIAVLARDANDRESQAKQQELNQLGEETLDLVRQLGRELRPSALDDLGLAAALERYARDFVVLHPGLVVDLHVDVPQRPSPPVETSLYRIVQEGMTNTARHAKAGNLSVLITQHGNRLKAISEDDGIGFNAFAAHRNGRSVGIHGMRERAELVEGSLTIESGRGGTTVFVEVPS
jgi:signal transduction histidine kinase